MNSPVLYIVWETIYKTANQRPQQIAIVDFNRELLEFFRDVIGIVVANPTDAATNCSFVASGYDKYDINAPCVHANLLFDQCRNMISGEKIGRGGNIERNARNA